MHCQAPPGVPDNVASTGEPAVQVGPYVVVFGRAPIAVLANPLADR